MIGCLLRLRRRCASVRAAAAAGSVVTVIAMGGCAIGDDGASERELAQARAEAAEQTRVEERQRQQNARQRQLERELEELRRRDPASGGESDAPATPPRASSPQQAPAGGSTSCGDEVTVGPNTSCPFARNVREAYDASDGGETSVTAFSPATGRTFTMSCTGGSPHVCTGGNDASVFFP